VSFDLHLQLFVDGEPAPIPLEIVRAALAPAIIAADEQGWQLDYGA
jgi:hypothetical protein